MGTKDNPKPRGRKAKRFILYKGFAIRHAKLNFNLQNVARKTHYKVVSKFGATIHKEYYPKGDEYEKLLALNKCKNYIDKL